MKDVLSLIVLVGGLMSGEALLATDASRAPAAASTGCPLGVEVSIPVWVCMSSKELPA